MNLKMPSSVHDFFSEFGAISRFVFRYFRELPRPRYEVKQFVKQCFLIGYKSFPLIGITGFIMGMVLTIQLRPTLVDYGVASKLPEMVGMAIVREIGPVITALIFAGKISSSIGAELGSMKVTSQIEAMEVSGTNPFKYLVVTRVLAATLMLPVLSILSDAIGLYGSFIGINIRANTSMYLFFSQVFRSLSFSDILPALIKTFFFGFTIGIIGCYKGYNSSRGTEGVGLSANSAVVASSLAVFIIDLLAVQLTNLLNLN